tara:strand:+ start:1239 stop:2615 length:1377 start_codon:yes stop_codon:yes gene_type:complete
MKADGRFCLFNFRSKAFNCSLPAGRALLTIMKRTLSSELEKNLNKKVFLQGRVYNLRKMGGINFLLLQDRDGLVQIVFDKLEEKVLTGSLVSITGKVKSEKRAPGGVEVLGEKVEIISSPVEEAPIDLSKAELKAKLSTLLDNRPITLRHEKVKAIFRVSNTVVRAYAEVMREMGFTEIKTPKILGAASEGGSNFFTIDYFGRKAFLAQSPQFYKQITAGVFERVFEIGPVFRAEPHFTTRHVNEYISLDAEIGFIQDHEDVMNILNKAVKYIFSEIKKDNKSELELYKVKVPNVPVKIPKIKLADMREIIRKKYKYNIPSDTDIDPKGERLAGKYAKEKYNSDFLFLTHYPTRKRPFYTMPDEKNPKETKSFDLIYAGVEMVTGSQRIHDYDMLVANIKKWGLKPKDFKFYLQAFKYAMQPHGGWGMGLERIVYQLLDLKSIKQAVLFPRDVKRLTP